MNDPEAPAMGLVVILAEDNDDHAFLIRLALERAAGGAVEIHRARDGSEAVELARVLRPDLLLLDLKMPGKSGYEVLEALKGQEALRRIPVAVLTSSGRQEDVARSYGLGGNHFLTKPEDPAELERSLKTLLSNLAELGEIRRGTGEMTPTGESALGPDTLLRRSLLNLGAFLAVLTLLFLLGRCSGALG